jgi:hypothetical protein
MDFCVCVVYVFALIVPVVIMIEDLYFSPIDCVRFPRVVTMLCVLPIVGDRVEILMM